MKFLCGHCKAKYQIADEKVEGRTLRMVCRECNREILIPGRQLGSGPSAARARTQSVPAPGTGSVLAAELRRQVAAGPEQRRGYSYYDEWHVAINDVPVGPMRRDEVLRKISMGAVHADSLAWREGLDDWMPARQIPELAVLFAPPPAASAAAVFSASMPATSASPAARTSLAPIGGRMGAEAAPFIEEVLPPVPPPDPAEQAAVSPLGRAVAEPSASRQMWQIAGPLFMMVCAGALIMMVGAVVGVKFLQAPSVVERQAAGSGPAPAAAGESRESSSVVELDLQQIDGVAEEQSAAGPQSPGKRTQPQVAKQAPDTTAKGSKLTAEEQAMLARMGGGLDQEADLRMRQASVGTSSGGGGGGLKAEQLMGVVSRGKRELQRCYESALRLNPTEETIRLDIEIAIGASGTVTEVKTRGQTLGDMNRCVERTVRMWRFPGAGDVTRTSFPVVFQPGG